MKHLQQLHKVSFKVRSYKKELLDGDAIPFEDIKKNLQELNTINDLLGGHRITLKGIQALLKNQTFSKPFYVVEIGCGGGDNLRVIKAWANNKGISLQLTGVDYNKECIAFAQQQPSNTGIEFIYSDYRTVAFSQEPHIIFSSLFCHHFTNDDLIQQLQWMNLHSTIGFFINDLHRHSLAYYSIKLLTKGFSKSYLVKNDAPLSVKRGFVKTDWRQLFSEAGITNYKCSWQWAFRWLITCNK